MTTWYAGANSINSGNNTGWLFSSAPPTPMRLTTTGNLLLNTNYSSTFDEVSGLVTTSGMNLYLDARVYNGTSVWTNIVGTNTGAFVGNVDYATGPARFNTQAVLNTTTDYLAVSPTLTFADGTEYTMGFWVRLRSGATATYQSLTGPGTVNPWLSVFTGDTTGDSWTIRFRESGTGTYYSSSNAGATNIQNNWTYLVVTVNASRLIKMYVNGVYHSDVTNAGANPANSSMTVSRICGGYASGGNYYSLQGSLGAAHMYTRVLSDAEILQNYNADAARFGLSAPANYTRLTQTGLLAMEFDEVTVPPVAMRQLNTGNVQVSGIFDETTAF